MGSDQQYTLLVTRKVSISIHAPRMGSDRKGDMEG